MDKREILLAYKEGKFSTEEVREKLHALKNLSAPSNGDSTSIKTPLSEGQHGLWMLENFASGMSAYNVPLAFRIYQPFDVEAFKNAYKFAIDQYPIFNTVISEENGIPHQHLDVEKICIEEESIAHLREDEITPYLTASFKAPFDIANGPLIKCQILQRSSNNYIVMVSVHHIIFDGTSAVLFIQALWNGYLDLRLAGRPKKQKSSAYFSDFVLWEKDMLSKTEGEEHLEYWKQQLSGSLPILALPTDYTRPALQSFKGATHRTALTPALTDKARNWAKQHHVNLSTLFLTIYKILLHRYAAQNEIIVGIPTVGRPQLRFDKTVGYFINTIAVRSYIDDSQSFKELLRQVQYTVTDGLDHSDYPFPTLVRALNIQRDPAYSPLFQASFVYQNFFQNNSFGTFGVDFPLDFQPEFIESVHQEGQYEFEFEMLEKESHFILNAKYNPDLYKLSTVDRMAEHFINLIEEVLENDSQQISKLDFSSPEEQSLVLDSWNESAIKYDTDRCIHDLFEQCVADRPDHIAVSGDGGSLTYKELDKKATQLALYLQGQGVGPDVLVGMCMSRSLDMIIGIFGILKAGGAYVPMDPEYPEHRIRYMLEDSNVSIMLTEEQFLEKMSALTNDIACQFVLVDKDWKKINKVKGELKREVEAHNLCYVIYTSGSTGKPKGVLNQHNNVTTLLLSTEKQFRFDERDVWTFFHSYCFDFSVWEIFGCLAFGGRLVVVPYLKSRSPQEFLQLLEQENVTVLNQTPSAFYQLVDLVDQAASKPRLSLKHVIFGGEALNPTRLQPWIECFPDYSPRLINMYGITETTVHVTFQQITNEHIKSPKSVIGSSIPSLNSYILDAHLKPVPVGIQGELYISGGGVARGYLGREQLTAERFIENPFDDTSKLYKTGDLARWLPDGTLEYLGRIDHQVKIRGFRIELGEIESVLLSHDLVQSAVVLAKDLQGTKQLIAYYLSEEEIDVNELRSHLQNDLPDYMLPASFVRLEEIPLTANGKVNRDKLLAIEINLESSQEYVAASNEIERSLTDIWQKVLEIEHIGVNDNFFELGGHSLLATQIISRINKDLSSDVSLSALFEYPTIKGLSKIIGSSNSYDVVAISSVVRPQHIPLSYAQERLWFLVHMGYGDQYHIPGLIRLKGQLDAGALQKTIDFIVERHESFRTGFVDIEGTASQVILPSASVSVEFHDLSSLRNGAQEKETHAINQDFITRPFDIAKAPLFRVALIRYADDHHVLGLCMHHIISDGWSMKVLIEEISAVYETYIRNAVPQLPALPVQYADFSVWQRQEFPEEILTNELAYWKEQLQGYTDLELPTDFPRPSEMSGKGGHMEFQLDKHQLDELKQFCQDEQVTSFAVFMSAVYLLLSRYSGQEDICMGVPIANRNHKDIEDLVGFFVNTLIIRMNTADESLTARQLVQKAQTLMANGQNHQNLPVERILEFLQPKRDLSRSPIFQVLVNYLNVNIEDFRFGECTVEHIPIEYDISKFDLTFAFSDDNEGFKIMVEYSHDLFKPETVARMGEHLMNLVVRLIERKDDPIAQIPITSPTENQHLLSAWNATECQYPWELCVHELFEKQAESTPESIALVLGRKKLTYAQLNEKSTKLALRLQQLNIKPDDLVGICMERSIDMIVTVMAILKAGAAYLPLDPEHPEERIRYMLEDSLVETVITQKKLKTKITDWSGSRVKNVVAIDQEWKQVLKTKGELNRAVKFHHLAYVIYTSGSTGNPKGVMTEHKSVVNHNLAAIASYGIGAEDRVLQFSTISFDIFVEEVFPTLIAGATLVLLDGKKFSEPEYLKKTIHQQKVSVLNLPTAYWHSLANEDFDDSKLKLVIIGGEKADVDHYKAWKSKNNIPVVNTYGPTETTVISLLYKMNGEVDSQQSIPIGRPIANTQIYILDKNNHPVPVGVPGELHISGDGLARGYLHRPELTEEKFIKNPFNPEVRMYKTGDLVQWQPDGNVRFVGRVDQQLKVRGFRVEPGEVEALLREHESVNEAVVVGRKVQGANQLVAYYIAESKETSIASGDLKDFLQSKLPDYMVPLAFVALEELPLTPNGKVDRKQLQEKELEFTGDNEYLAAQTTAENVLVDVWQEVLGLQRVGVQDNFFELGGDSIKCIQVVSKAAQKGVHFTVKDIFVHQSILSLAANTKERKIYAPQEQLEGMASLGPVQQWFFQQQHHNVHHWNQSLMLNLSKEMSVKELESIFNRLQNHHDALRLRFKKEGQEWQQYYESPSSVPVITVDLSKTSSKSLDSKIKAESNKLQASLNIQDGPIMKAVLFNLGKGRGQRILVVIHHLVVDGVSWRIIIEDITTLLTAEVAVNLPDKTTSFQYWNEKLADYKADLQYWLTEANKSQRTESILDAQKPLAQPDIAEFELDQESSDLLIHQSAAAYNTQINDLLLSALLIAYKRWVGKDQMALTLEGHGREELFDDVDISRTVGWFTTMYPVVFDKISSGDIASTIKYTKEKLRSVPQKGISYGVQKYMHNNEKLQTVTLPEISFNYLGEFTESIDNESFVNISSEPMGNTIDSDYKTLGLGINGMFQQGKLSFNLGTTYALKGDLDVSVLGEYFKESLLDITRHCTNPQKGGMTPSDQPLINWDQTQLDEFLNINNLDPQHRNIESIHPLSPLQSGILFETLNADGDGMYFIHTLLSIDEPIDLVALQKACQLVIDRYDVLRTSVYYQGINEPVQVTFREVPFQLEEEHWDKLDEPEKEERLLALENRKEINLTNAPLFRATAIDYGNGHSKLFIETHHIIMDGWSNGLFWPSLLFSYARIKAGQTVSLPIASDYRQYIQALSERDSQQSLDFWSSYLEGVENTGALPLLNLSEDKARETGKHFGKISFDLTKAQSKDISQLSRKARVTTNTIIQACLGIVLAKLSGDEDAVYGSVNSGRSLEGLDMETMVGLLINTTPIRITTSENTTLNDILLTVQDNNHQRLIHEHTPLAEINKIGDWNHQKPLFRVLYIYENYPTDIEQFEEYSLPITDIKGYERDNYPLSVMSALDGDLVRFQIDFDKGYYDEKVVGHIRDYLLKTICQLIEDATIKTRDFSLLSEKQEHKLLVEVNSTFLDYPKDKCIHQLFKEQVERTPDKTALISDGQILTYAQLDHSSSQLAIYLQQKGIKPDTLVGLCMGRSFDMIIALLGILKAGGAYLPLDPTYPEERLKYLIEDSKVENILTQKALVDQVANWSEGSAECIVVDQDWDEISQTEGKLVEEVQPQHMAYVIYTSGSTGKPKGVMVEHRNVVNHNFETIKTYGINQEDKIMQFSSVSFDVFVEEVFPTLISGASLIILDGDKFSELNYFKDTVHTEGVTILNLPTAYWHSIANVKFDSEQLRLAVIGGEKADTDHYNTWMELNGIPVINAYGPTETTVMSVLHKIEDKVNANEPLPIGKPIANTQVYVLDKNRLPVPEGVPGELYISGDGVSRGYLFRPELTKEKFLDNPFIPGTKMYKTGDLVQWESNGLLQFLGRVDNQVKIRGFRIELGEIEAVLNQHKSINEAVVIAKELNGSHQLIAYYVKAAEIESLEAIAIKSFLQGSLPEYMIPMSLLEIDNLPITVNGKVDRKALESLELNLSSTKEFVAAKTNVEHALTQIWSDVLGADRVGINDNFFDLGGDSIKSIQVVSKAAQKNIYFTVKDIFTYQNIAQLSVNTKSRETHAEQGLMTGNATLAPIQHWFFEQNHTNAHHWNQSVMLDLKQEVDQKLLQNALNKLVLHHDALRLRFKQDQHGYAQYYTSSNEAPLSVVNLGRIARKNLLTAIEKEANKAQQGLNIEEGPIIRAVLFNLGKNEGQRLLIVCHHLVVDGVSWRIILEDLSELLKNTQVSLPAKTTAFSYWNEKLISHEEEKEYWLSEVDNTTKARRFIDSNQLLSKPLQLEFRLESGATHQIIHKSAGVYNTQINDLLLSALLMAYQQWSGDRGMALTLEGHGREELFEEVDHSRTVGWFTTMFPVLFEKENDQDWSSTIKYVKEKLRGIPHKGIGYGTLKYLQKEVRLTDVNYPELSFNYLGEYTDKSESDQVLMMSDEPMGQTVDAQYISEGIDINAFVKDKQLFITIDAIYSLVDGYTLSAFGDLLITSLKDLAAHCYDPSSGGITPSDVPLLSWDQHQIDQFLSFNDLAENHKNIESIHPLSPLQSGILFETLNANLEGMYFTNSLFGIDEHIDSAAFGRACQLIVDRYDVFRTGIYYKDLEVPVQVTFKQLTYEVETLDWRGLNENQKEERLDQLEHQKQLSIDDIPLLKVMVIHYSEAHSKLFIVNHHTIIDGWSNALFLQSLVYSYSKIKAGQEVSLPKPPDYRDYIQAIVERDQENDIDFWKQYLDGLDEATPLPLFNFSDDLEKEPGQYFDKIAFSLTSELSHQVGGLSRDERVTVNSVMQTALGITLAKLNGQEDVAFGSVGSGRSLDGLNMESMVGLLINTTPVRVQAKEHMTLKDILTKVQDDNRNRMIHEHTPLNDIYKIGDWNHQNPLFQVLYVYENYPTDVENFNSNDVAISDVKGMEQDHHALSVMCAMDGEDIKFVIGYDRACYSEEVIRQLWKYLEVTIEAITLRGEIDISDFSLLSDNEKYTLFEEINKTQKSYPTHQCFHDLFIEQALATPDYPAIFFEGSSMSYEELNLKSDQLAKVLQQQGVGPEVLVGLLVERGFEMMVAMFAILKAGGAYLPIDTDYPDERVQYMLEDSNTGLLITHKKLENRVSKEAIGHDLQIMSYEELVLESETVTGELTKSVKTTNMAYIIYTSGSTGKPKGVMIEHRNVVNLLLAVKEESEFKPKDRSLAIATYSFDICIMELFVPLISGGELHIAHRDNVKDTDLLRQCIEEVEPNTMFATPATWSSLFQSGWKNKQKVRIFCGGEALNASLKQSLDETSQVTWNMYGPTETTVITTTKRLKQGERATLGKPLSNMRVYVVDKKLNPVPNGVPGELCIAGKGVSRGYLNRPELTREYFVDDPFEESGRMYRTGDLVRLLENGEIEFLGRIDNQVKIRGFRIELGEIEYCLTTIDEITEAVVLVKERGEVRQLICFYTATSRVDPADIKAHLVQHLPDYMIPVAFEFMTVFPLTSSGKIDRKALLKLNIEIVSGENYVPPGNETEQALVDIWQELLGVDRIGINDNFFELGGDSLMAVQVSARISKEFKREVSIRSLFEHLTIKELSAFIRDADEDKPEDDIADFVENSGELMI